MRLFSNLGTGVAHGHQLCSAILGALKGCIQVLLPSCNVYVLNKRKDKGHVPFC